MDGGMKEDSAHEPLAEGGLITGYWILTPLSIAARIAALGAAALPDAGLGLSETEE